MAKRHQQQQQKKRAKQDPTAICSRLRAGRAMKVGGIPSTTSRAKTLFGRLGHTLIGQIAIDARYVTIYRGRCTIDYRDVAEALRTRARMIIPSQAPPSVVTKKAAVAVEA
jgi:hypothetical protein